ncbi:DEAD/DEAH box helicase [Azospirillum halopraeferens]|uniref:DEAD/DEAH box helicase n=1 Tax=Azospirillum halopraeferens TaxID=34010 RepID=UPI0003F9EEAE|nr:DEAD/DEAH box helicase [Azospirillum halopraeferens]
MLGLFWGRTKRTRRGETCLSISYDRGGIVFRGIGRFAELPASEWLARGHEVRGRHGDAVLYLAQLEQDGIVPTLGDECILGWREFHDLKNHPDHADGLALLDLPPTCTLTPELTSTGALSDPTFVIALAWLDGSGRPVQVERKGGAIVERGAPSLLPGPAWRLAEAVTAFSQRDDSARTRTEQERAWGRIRLLAREAGARFDGFLSRTIVLTPERLNLSLRPTWQGDTQVVELVPGLTDVPSDKWLAAYDAHSRVQDHYVLTTDDGGLVRVIPSPAVLRLLAEIKRMPGRRVAGQRAKAFLRNPYATLGEDIAEALPPEVFEVVRRQAGLSFYAFSSEAVRDAMGRIEMVRLHILPDNEQESPPPPQDLADKQAVKQFRDQLAKALKADEPCVTWRGRDLDLRGDAREQLATLTLWLGENWAVAQPSLSYDEVYDLGRYGERIAGIGIEKPVHAPYLAAAAGDAGWMPDALACVVTWQPPGAAEPVRIALTENDFHRLAERTQSAEAAGEATVGMPEWPAPLSVENAQELVRAIAPAFSAPPSPARPVPEVQARPPASDHASRRAGKETLLLKSNLEQEEYVERRAENLRWEPHEQPVLPQLLRPDIALKPHQLAGVAWLQHLWRNMPRVRGCIFADDMGLGKTLQMLTFIAWYLETTPEPAPVLVVAPVSLLENWGNEIRKFFKPGLRVLTLYGSALKEVRLTRDAVDEQLIARGLCKFLRSDWLGDAQVVLTTYETLRDQEFSLSAQRWGIMVCDEAQKIKTPTSLVTRAAKKQNALFRIACTGTPVENRLADLWCLFDFVQPGLLGPLANFCRTYSRPIEARTDEQLAALDRLRRLIEPQVMRRMKEDVAELPPKISDDGCRALPLSPRQTALYTQALQAYRAKVTEADGNATMVVLGMLHTLRSICAHPVSAEELAAPPPLDEFRRHSPKMRWLMAQLERIRASGEKAIIFTEFREIQRALQRYIGEAFDLSVTVINGDTTAQSASGQSRQARIDAFQASPGFNVIILSTTAVGFGVNVQAANHVIHFTRPWNPAKEDQATDRAYRIGQTKPVTVYCPTVVSNEFVSFEAKLDLLLEAKRELARDMLNGSEDISEADWRDI